MTEVASLLCVPMDHPVLSGHFPGRPIVPGVMLLEWVLREAGNRMGRRASDLRVRECKFLEPLLPAETATLDCSIDARRCIFRIQRGITILATGVIEST